MSESGSGFRTAPDLGLRGGWRTMEGWGDVGQRPNLQVPERNSPPVRI